MPDEDHPRLRGKNVDPKSVAYNLAGSPPLTREKLYNVKQADTGKGITPAYAGKT